METKQLRQLTRQMQNISEILVGDHYNFTKQDNVFTFVNQAGQSFTIKCQHSNDNFNVSIKGPNNQTTRTQFKPVDTSYLGYMMRKVEGTNNYAKGA